MTLFLLRQDIPLRGNNKDFLKKAGQGRIRKRRRGNANRELAAFGREETRKKKNSSDKDDKENRIVS